MKAIGEIKIEKEKDDRRMGDYSNDNPIGKHVTLTKYGEVKTLNY